MEYCYIVSEETDEFCFIGAFYDKDLALEAVEEYMAKLERAAEIADRDFTRKDCFFCDIETDVRWVWCSDYFGKYIYIDRVRVNTLMV